MSLVLDASMAISFVIGDEHNPRSRRALERVASAGALVPPLWDYEVFNAIRAAQSSGRLSAAAAANAIHGLERLVVVRDDRPVNGLRLIDLAATSGLSVYDAAYLAIALDRNLPLATLDSRLAAAADRAGVPVLQ